MASVDGNQPDVRCATAERRFAALASLELGMQPRYRLALRLPDGSQDTTVTWSGVDHTTLEKLSKKLHSAPVRGDGDEHQVWPDLRRGRWGARSCDYVPSEPSNAIPT